MGMIKSELLDRLSGNMAKAAKLISDSIKDKTPILIRHHADCDGYAGAIALERAIGSLLNSVHRRESDVHFYYKRLPSKTPFYDISDASKDISMFLSDNARFGRKAPLVIVVDNGSCTEDLLALRLLKLYKVGIVVIDHHPPHDENDSYIDVHVNPWLEDGTSAMSAGMVASEVAHMLDSKAQNIDLLAGLAGVADRSDGPEIESYISMCHERDFPRERLRRIADALDFELSQIGYLESRYLVNDLFFGDMDVLTGFIEIVESHLAAKIERQKVLVKHYMQIQNREGFDILMLDLSGTRPGNYPSSGKTTGILLEMAGERQAVAIGAGDDFMTFRISKGLPFDVNEIIARARSSYPYALVEGGGHPHAGTMRFVATARQEVMKTVLEILR
jgi:archaea-specific RecJ-like exonuclease